MIKITNLMVGDWVNLNFDIDYKTGKSIYAPTQITGINKDGTVDVNFTYDKSKSMQGGWDLKLIKPIPLTTEILEKNGWILKEWSRHKQFQYTIEECGDEIIYKIDYERPHFIVQCFRSGLELKYVHNFQHLLKECEIEKEIVL